MGKKVDEASMTIGLYFVALSDTKVLSVKLEYCMVLRRWLLVVTCVAGSVAVDKVGGKPDRF